MKENNSIFKFKKTKTTLPLLECKTVSGKEFLALVDTGSEVTIIDESLRSETDPDNREDGSIILQSLHGEVEENITLCKLLVDITNTYNELKTIPINGIVSDLSPASNFLKQTHNFKEDTLVIIGSDTLNHIGAIIDCELNQIFL